MIRNFRMTLTVVLALGLFTACSSDDEASTPAEPVMELLLPSAIKSPRKEGGSLERYTYDAQNRLTKIEHEDDDEVEIEKSGITFIYAADKLTEVKVYNEDITQTNATYTYTYTGDKLSSIKEVTASETQEFAVETENGRITKMTSAKKELSFIYDEKGNLIEKIFPKDSNIAKPGETESFEYIYDTTKESIYRNVNTPFGLTVFIWELDFVFASPNLPTHSIYHYSPEEMEDELFIWSDFKEGFPYAFEIGYEGQEKTNSTIEYIVSK